VPSLSTQLFLSRYAQNLSTDCDWKTLEGVHVCIKDGVITKGPSKLVGKNPSKLSPRTKYSTVKIKPSAHDNLYPQLKGTPKDTDTVDEDGKPSKLQSAIELPYHVEHFVAGKIKSAAKSALGYLQNKLNIAKAGGKPSIAGKVAHGVTVLAVTGLKAAYLPWIAGEKAVEAVARAKGLSADEAAKVRSLVTCYDAINCKAMFLGLEHAGLQHAAKASLFIPTASVAYLGTQGTLAVARAASNAVKSVAGGVKAKLHLSLAANATDAVGTLADAIKAHGGDDWYFALLVNAMQRSHSTEQAVALADQAFSRNKTAPTV